MMRRVLSGAESALINLLAFGVEFVVGVAEVLEARRQGGKR